MDSETLRQIYVPKWNVVNESVLDDPDVCRSLVDQLALHGLFSQLRGIDYDQLFAEFNVGAARQTCLGAEEKDAKIANLKAQFLKKRNTTLEKEKDALEGQVAALESVAATKDTKLESLNAQTAKLTQDLYNLQLSCDELSIKAASLESQRDGLIHQVSSLETTCSRLHDQVSGYELFKEHCEAFQDEQVNVLSGRMAGLYSKLMALALHSDEEFYPRFLTTIAGRR
ncbi:hypothetical protein Tco_0648641 [Tanacetum coccineum]